MDANTHGTHPHPCKHTRPCKYTWSTHPVPHKHTHTHTSMQAHRMHTLSPTLTNHDTHTHANTWCMYPVPCKHTHTGLTLTPMQTHMMHMHTHANTNDIASLVPSPSQVEWIIGLLGIYNGVSETWTHPEFGYWCYNVPSGPSRSKTGTCIFGAVGISAPLWSWPWLGTLSEADGFTTGSHRTTGHFLKGWPPSHHISLVAAFILSVRITVFLSLSICHLCNDLLPSKATVIV